ncbi:MAG: DUF4270 family protein [Muribaculaceae bacterium]|nr:DUF4270 family protein [Muribaculaceae bacterium]
MKLYKLSTLFLFTIALFITLTACEEDTTSIGSVIAPGNVTITIDEIDYDLMAKPVPVESFDAKTGNLMIGNIQRDNYGNLFCSFVTSLMCSANLQIPDSLFNLPDFTSTRVDSCKLVLGAQRKGIIGDSLAPQKLEVFLLKNPLSGQITNTFNPEGDYYTEPLASKSYTVAEIASSDSVFYHNNYVQIDVNLPVEFGRTIIDKYKQQPSLFQWPQTMAKEFLPGFYVKTTFGNGCIANIESLYVAVFYHSLAEVKETVGEGDEQETVTKVKHVNNVVFPFTISPEVVSSNIIEYQPSQNIINHNQQEDGTVVITTPGGYMAEFIFPMEDLIDRYSEDNIHLTTLNDIELFIPAESFDPESGLGIVENLLMIKSTDYEEFFNKNKVPDNITSFAGVYDSTNQRYYFGTLRNLFLNLINKEEITDEDVSFMLIPVEIETETSNSYYSSATYVTKCVPFTSKPTMTLLKTNEAQITFSFSTQII